MRRDGALVAYASAHGYGHATRLCDLLRAVAERRPDLPIVLVSRLPAAFLRARLPLPGLALRRAAPDPGLAARDAIDDDPDAGLDAAEAWTRTWAQRRRRETAWLAAAGARAVLCDIPGAPLEAAQRLGIPGLAVGNFGWDWIYRRLAERNVRWAVIAERFAAAYVEAGLLLRLPFHEPMAAFPRPVDVPLAARPGRNRRAALAAAGIPPDVCWILLGLRALDWTPAARARVERLEGMAFLALSETPPGRNIYRIDREAFPFSDVLASCDAVLSKPGYGILAECAVNDRPLVHIARQGSPEVDVLLPAIRRHLRQAPLSRSAWEAGDLAPAIKAALQAHAAEPAPADGGELAAEQVLKAIGEGPA